MITLYHGSNIAIKQIDLSICNPDKDFGQGFYLTDIEGQARQMALRTTNIKGCGSPTVSSYSFDEKLLDDTELNVLTFDAPCKDWALFVMANREASRTGFKHSYDIVVGPVADDGVAFQLERYARKMISLETLVEELTYKRLNRQFFFGTELALSKLVKL